MDAIQVRLPLEQVQPQAVDTKDLSLTWQMYTGDTTDAQARTLFERRRGYPPDLVWRPYSHLVYAGPVREARA